MPRIVALFTKKSKSRIDDCGAGIALGSDAFLVVQLQSHMLHLVIHYFVLQGNSYTEAEVKMESMQTWQTWYSIVDGVSTHAAVLLLMKTETTWRDFMRYVITCKSECPLEQYQQHARLQNIRHGPVFYVDFTFPNLMLNIRFNMIA